MTGHPMTLAELLAHGDAALDGGLASELESRGHDLTGTLWSARLLAEDPEAIRDVHTAYFLAGASVGISASYQASRAGFERHGLGADEADRMLALSVSLVREARAVAAGRGSHHPMLVAASVGPYGATLHDGSEYRGRYGVSHGLLVDFHRERLEVLVHARPDFLAIETIPDLDEARAVVEALKGFAAAAWMSFSCADDATTCAGQPIEDAAALVADAGLAAIGINCTKPEHVLGLVGRIRAARPAGGRLPQRRSRVGRRGLGVARRRHRPAAAHRRPVVVRRGRVAGGRVLRARPRRGRRHRRRRDLCLIGRGRRRERTRVRRRCCHAPEPERQGRGRAVAFRVTDRLNRVTRIYLGPAPVGEERRPTVVTPIEQQAAACPACGQPLSQHELVRSESSRQRLHCPRPPRSSAPS